MCLHDDQAHGTTSHVGPSARDSIHPSQEATRRPRLRSIAFNCLQLRVFKGLSIMNVKTLLSVTVRVGSVFNWLGVVPRALLGRRLWVFWTDKRYCLLGLVGSGPVCSVQTLNPSGPAPNLTEANLSLFSPFLAYGQPLC